MRNIFFLLLAFFTAYFSMNGQWHPINKGLFGGDVFCLETAGDMVFAGTNTGIYRTQKDKNLWSVCGVRGNAITCLAKNNKMLFAGTRGKGVFRSTNNGDYWEPINKGFSEENKYVQSIFCDGNILFVRAHGENILRSEDNGDTWKLSSLTDKDIRGFAKINNEMFAASQAGVIYHSFDAGSIWKEKYIDSAGKKFGSLFSIDSLLFSIKNNTIRRSTDRGITWQTTVGGIKTIEITALTIMDTKLFISSDNEIYRSDNYGNSWISIGDTLLHKSISSLVVIDTIIYAGCEIGTYKSRNKGYDWTLENNGLGTLKVNTLTEHNNILFAGVWGLGVFKSSDKGNTWKPANNGITSLDIRTLFSSDKYLFACVRDNGVFRSSDYGNTWEVANNGLKNMVANDMTQIGHRLYLGSHYKRFDNRDPNLYYSSDYGDHWVPIDSLNVQADKVFAMDNVLFINSQYMDQGGSNFDKAGIFRTTDLGYTWQNLNQPFSNAHAWGFSLHLNDFAAIDKTLFVTGLEFCKSEDLGNTWRCHDSRKTKIGVSTLGVHNSILFAGANSSIYGDAVLISWDKGETWSYAGLDNVRVLKFVFFDNEVFIATNDGVWKNSLQSVLSSAEESLPIMTKNDFTISPNPVSENITLNFDAVQESRTVTITSYLGSTVIKQAINPQESVKQFDVSTVPNGVYFVRINDSSEPKKIIILH